MVKTPEEVEIKDPLLQEISKKRSCFTKSCASSCGCLVFLVIGFLIFMKLIALPRANVLKEIPPWVTSYVPVYSEDHIEKITYKSEKTTGRDTEIIGYGLKIITLPGALFFESEHEKKSKKLPDEAVKYWHRIQEHMTEPLTDPNDSLEIIWNYIPTNVEFIEDYYITELKKRGYKVGVGKKDSVTRIIKFTNTKKEISGIITIEDREGTSDTESVALTVTLPSSSIIIQK